MKINNKACPEAPTILNLTDDDLQRLDAMELDQPLVLNALAKLVSIHLETVNPERARWYATPRDGGTFSGTLAEVGAYVRGYATAYAGGMPKDASTRKLLQGAITAAGEQLSGTPRDEDYPAPTPYPPIRAGNLLYAVGPGHPTRHRVYSTVVRDVRPEGSYRNHYSRSLSGQTRSASASAPPELPASATLLIELGADRPLLGFPECVYRSHDIGINVYRSGAEALRSFTKNSLRLRDEAERTREIANDAVKWARAEIATYTGGKP